MSPGRTQSFSASYDTTTTILSAFVCVVFIAAAVFTRNAFVAGLGMVLIGFSYAWSPRAYALSDHAIVVRRLIGDARIPLDGVREIRPVASDDLRGCIRLWGSGGLFGYYGLFRTSKLGKCTWYVTNRSRAVILITSGKTAVFSPDDLDGFLAAVRMAAPIPETLSGAWDPAVDSGRTGSGAWIGAAIALAVVAVVAAAFTYSPGPPKVTLTTRALTIHDLFYGFTLQAADVDVARIRVVDLTVDHEWSPTLRTNGFANFHYRSGWFKVANGRRVRLFAAKGKRLVLLPPNGNGAPVLLEVPDPQNFVEQLLKTWGATGSRRLQPSDARSKSASERSSSISRHSAASD